VALELAIDRPDRVAAAVVANSRPSLVGPEMAATVDGWIALLLEEDGPVRRLRVTWPMLANEPFRNSTSGRAVFDAWARVLANVPGTSLCHVARGMTHFDRRTRLSAIGAPVLVISGEQDRLFSPEYGQAISSEIAGSRHELLLAAGHLSNLDSPDQFNRLLLSFSATIGRHEPAAREYDLPVTRVIAFVLTRPCGRI
jgi:pimeloyl-ACP methyl ester carboxylesterase